MNRLRVEEACRRLEGEGDGDLLAIALEVGYGSKASFNRAFRAHAGTTPTVLRLGARLLDLGVQASLIASTLRCVVAQRLVRRLCIHCREPYEAPAELLAQLPALLLVAAISGDADSVLRAVLGSHPVPLAKVAPELPEKVTALGLMA